MSPQPRCLRILVPLERLRTNPIPAALSFNKPVKKLSKAIGDGRTFQQLVGRIQFIRPVYRPPMCRPHPPVQDQKRLISEHADGQHTRIVQERRRIQQFMGPKHTRRVGLAPGKNRSTVPPFQKGPVVVGQWMPKLALHFCDLFRPGRRACPNMAGFMPPSHAHGHRPVRRILLQQANKSLKQVLHLAVASAQSLLPTHNSDVDIQSLVLPKRSDRRSRQASTGQTHRPGFCRCVNLHALRRWDAIKNFGSPIGSRSRER